MSNKHLTENVTICLLVLYVRLRNGKITVRYLDQSLTLHKSQSFQKAVQIGSMFITTELKK